MGDGALSMKPNFNAMSVFELRTYVLTHRDDIDAIRALFFHPSLVDKYQEMPALYENGEPVAENIRLAEEKIRQLAEQDSRKNSEKE